MQRMIYVKPGSTTAAVEQYCRDNKKSFSGIIDDALSFYATQKGIVEPDAVMLLKQALALLESK